LEASARGPREVGDLGRDLLLVEVSVEQGAHPRGERHGRREAIEARKGPVAVDARVPVEAAVEDRVQLARALHVTRAGHDMIELVRVLAGDMAERDRTEARGEIVCEGVAAHAP